MRQQMALIKNIHQNNNASTMRQPRAAINIFHQNNNTSTMHQSLASAENVHHSLYASKRSRMSLEDSNATLECATKQLFALAVPPTMRGFCKQNNSQIAF